MTPHLPHRPRPEPARRVCVFGEALVDELPSGPVPGGAPLNVACHAAGFGLEPLLLSRVGRDAAGEALLATLAARGVPAGGVEVDPVLPTGRAVVSLRGGAPRFEIAEGTAFDAIDGTAAALAAREWRPSVVAFGTLALRGPASRAALGEVLASTKAARLADLNLRAPWYDGSVVCRALSSANVVKVSDEELEEVRRLLSLPIRDPEALSADVVRRFRLRTLYVTRGAKGAYVASRSGDAVRFAEAPAEGPPGAVVDTVGAGDAFTSVVLLGLVEGWTAEDVVRRGVAFAGAVTRISGATPADRSFYAPFLSEWGAVAA
ncbi:MAG: carbohydrate kinase [Thermoanaerobaculia bacterium]|nr:carbohydrate kinase [Thermoanaerobaculia bacterium]